MITDDFCGQWTLVGLLTSWQSMDVLSPSMTVRLFYTQANIQIRASGCLLQHHYNGQQLCKKLTETESEGASMSYCGCIVW